MGEVFRQLIPIIPEVKPLEQVVHAPRNGRLRDTEDIPDELHEFPRRELVVEERKIRHVSELRLRPLRVTLHIEAADIARSPTWA